MRVYIVDMGLAKEMLWQEDCLSFGMKKSCVWQTYDLKMRSRGK